jgi:AcrR family transcriptional regulator
MARAKGSRNRDFDETRNALLARITQSAEKQPEILQSFNELAKEAQVSRTTLRHYFVDRDNLVAALIHYWARLGPTLPGTETPSSAKAELTHELGLLVRGWSSGLGQVFELGLRPSLRHPKLGPTFVNEFLEPLLVRYEKRLALLQDHGLLQPGAAREASLELVSPVLMVLMHQHSLLGSQVRPLDVEAFVARHVKHFLSVWGTFKK